MSIPYALRVQRETRSKLFVNNPTRAEAKSALEFEVVGATTNPTYLARLASLAGEREELLEAMRPLAAAMDDDNAVFEKLQIRFVAKLAAMYLPTFEATGGGRGLVFMQGNPLKDGDPDYMVAEALRFFAIGPNIVVKLPSNRAGLKAFRALAAMGKRLCATSGLSLSQEEAFFKAFREVNAGPDAPLPYITSLAGILEEYARKYASENRIEIGETALAASGNLFSKVGYRMMRDEKYRGILQGGGARNLSHFTEMVGSAFECTVNYVFIEQMNRQSPPVEDRHRNMYAPEIAAELRAKLPFYSLAIDRGAMTPEEFDAYPPFAYFRGTFTAATERILALVRECRTGETVVPARIAGAKEQPNVRAIRQRQIDPRPRAFQAGDHPSLHGE